MRRIILALALLVTALPAFGQSAPPYGYPFTIGTSPTQVLGVNNMRRRLIFFNPNDVAKVALCPPTVRGAAITCAVNGAGSITILPYGSFSAESGVGSGSPLTIGGSWSAVASAGGSNLTILEFE